MEKGKNGETYNIGGGNEKTNNELTNLILKNWDKGDEMIEFVKDRLGHDRRYALDFEKIKELGYIPSLDFEQRLKETIIWYKGNEKWWKPLLGKAIIKTKVA